MSFWFVKSRRKGLAKRLRRSLIDYQSGPSESKMIDVVELVKSVNETLNEEEFKRDDLPRILNHKIYRDDTVSLLINSMPFFDQPALNSISTLLQTTVREFQEESLPIYLINNPDVLNRLLTFFQHPLVSTVSHVLVRTCIKSEQFTRYLYQSGVVGSFVQYLSGDSFDSLSTSFTTYECMLMSHPHISAEFFNEMWQIFSIQFKQLMHSPNYLVQLTFLPILYKFIVIEEARLVFYLFLSDLESLQLIMTMLLSTSKKVQTHAYSIFKLFIINPRKTEQIKSTLKANKSKLIKYLKDFKFDDGNQELEDEKVTVITTINNLK